MKVICIDDSAKPAEIPNSYWVKKDNIYTVINAFKDMNGVLLFQLEEIRLENAGTLYKGFASSRFKPLETTEQEIKREVEQPKPEYA